MLPEMVLLLMVRVAVLVPLPAPLKIPAPSPLQLLPEMVLLLMVHDQFPRLHRPSPESSEILRMLRYRQKLVKMRTIGKNSLQALALQSGLSLRTKLFTKAGKQQLHTAVMSAVME